MNLTKQQQQHINKNSLAVNGRWQNGELDIYQYCLLYDLPLSLEQAAYGLLTNDWQTIGELKRKWESTHDLFYILYGMEGVERNGLSFRKGVK